MMIEGWRSKASSMFVAPKNEIVNQIPIDERKNNVGLFNTVTNAVQKLFTVKYISNPPQKLKNELDLQLMRAKALSFHDLSVDISVGSFSVINIPGVNNKEDNKVKMFNNVNIMHEHFKAKNCDMTSIDLETNTPEEFSWSELGKLERSYDIFQDESIAILTDRSGQSNSGFELIEEMRSPRITRQDSFMFPVESESHTTMTTISCDQSLGPFEEEITELKEATYNSLLAELDHIWYLRRSSSKRW